jgi:proteasome lid subunit RPN8/RPN11
VADDPTPESYPLAPEPAVLPRALWRQMIEQARAEAPYEACGLVAGDAQGRALRYHPMRNAAGRLDWFEPDPLELLRLTMALEDAGETLWGIYHSHPRSPARPSASDIAGAQYPDSLYLIGSLLDPARPVIRAFRIVDGRVTEVRLEVTD